MGSVFSFSFLDNYIGFARKFVKRVSEHFVDCRCKIAP